jgi:NADPH:quinone reductase-like Zn-dependent oxidoreductase
MRAMVIREHGGPDTLHWEDCPTPQPGENELLVAVHATSVNPVDTKVRAGTSASAAPFRWSSLSFGLRTRSFLT